MVAKRNQMRQQETRINGLALALSVYSVLFIGKLLTYFVTKIGVMYAEALHSLADMMISGFLLVSAMWSRKPADANYRFGYGRAQNVAALAAATVFISFTSLEAYREGISELFGERTKYSNFALAFVVTIIAIFISSLPLIKTWLGREKGAASRAQFIESINDEVALLAALIGIIFISKGVPIADAFTSLIVATVIGVNAGVLWWQNAQTLIGRSPGADFYAKVEEIARSVKGVRNVHDMRAEYVGSEIHLGMHIEVARGTPIEEADRIAEEVYSKVGESIQHSHCVIHVDPERTKTY